ncbi:hypothetical protein BDN72DRAFT_208776 [Pluteus cervinus]|uniref:Uncharacterized protein n=1 Tax=Pluteus cervinus TaxID=181527 RepID=A0ACD3AHP7_9AGAR|nr:hypothetical protein BDN72DRAFT_208776 [Pluteus cervinus]
MMSTKWSTRVLGRLFKLLLSWLENETQFCLRALTLSPAFSRPLPPLAAICAMHSPCFSLASMFNIRSSHTRNSDDCSTCPISVAIFD